MLHEPFLSVRRIVFRLLDCLEIAVKVIPHIIVRIHLDCEMIVEHVRMNDLSLLLQHLAYYGARSFTHGVMLHQIIEQFLPNLDCIFFFCLLL